MTASISFDTAVTRPASYGRFPGLGALLRKDGNEWLRGRRAWIVLAITTVWMTLTAASGWISSQIAATLPPDIEPPVFTMSPLENLLSAVGGQIFVIAAILAVVSLIVSERQSGTLAWTASKPVSRTAIWLSKWLSAAGFLAVTAAIVPLLATVGLVVVLYGAPPIELVIGSAFGMVAIVTFYAAVGIAAGTVMPGQAAIAATGLAVFALVPALIGLIPVPLDPFLPTSILSWALATASGVDAGWVTPVAWVVGTALIAGFGINRLNRVEL